MDQRNDRQPIKESKPLLKNKALIYIHLRFKMITENMATAMPQNQSIFRRVTSMEPLLPAGGGAELAELSAEIFRKPGELSATLPAKSVRICVAALIRETNSYYSNLIEGHKTLPRDIERAFNDDFSER